MGCLALSYYEQGLPPFAGRSVFLSTAKAPDLRLGQAAQRTPQGNAKSCAGSYKFGFNGQEKVNEIAGIGNHTTALFWEYDTRIARRWNIDPVDQISISNYSVMRLNPIINTDVLGNLATGPDTDVYNSKTGNKVGTVKDNLPDAVSVVDIEESKEGEASQMINEINQGPLNLRNEAGRFIRGQAASSASPGTGNYDVNDFSAWYNRSAQSVQATKLAGVEVGTNAQIAFNNKATKLFAEVSNNLRLVNNIVKSGTIPNGTYFDAQMSPNAYALPNETGKLSGVGIHLHPVVGNVTITDRNRPAPFNFIGNFYGGYNQNDRNMVSPTSKYRSVAVDAKNIYLMHSAVPVISIKR